MSDWKQKPQSDLEATIAEFKATLPGWWYSICECQVSCDASCAPTTETDDIDLIRFNPDFDSGFFAYLAQPSTLAEALRDVMAQALKAKSALTEQAS